MNSANQWLTYYWSYILLALILIASFNYLMDPMWFFNHENTLNKIQLMIDERQQKTNWLCSHPVCFDSVLMGSSRGTYINQNDFKNNNCFNYSVSSMKPEEYEEYLEFFCEKNQKTLRKIFIGLDFFGTNKNARFDFQKPSQIINNAKSRLWFFKMLFN